MHSHVYYKQLTYHSRAGFWVHIVPVPYVLTSRNNPAPCIFICRDLWTAKTHIQQVHAKIFFSISQNPMDLLRMNDWKSVVGRTIMFDSEFNNIKDILYILQLIVFYYINYKNRIQKRHCFDFKFNEYYRERLSKSNLVHIDYGPYSRKFSSICTEKCHTFSPSHKAITRFTIPVGRWNWVASSSGGIHEVVPVPRVPW